ncbi:hypothetical protein CLV55_1149 [Flavobacterium aciduliphilum]|uniref:Uncharacterized protein n=1 Tax=Flavobacterium aciduliphilum TaxID=1101402 RepID=A0A328YI99_9FLAO|nr:hypothetical protein CLV55_1149 [Flavobacterium aciduliphilum]
MAKNEKSNLKILFFLTEFFIKNITQTYNDYFFFIIIFAPHFQ